MPAAASSSTATRIVADIPYNDNNSMPAGAITPSRLLFPSLPKKMFSSPSLSLALGLGLLQRQPLIENNQSDGTRMGKNFKGSVGRRSRGEEHENRSGSDNLDGASSDDQDAADKPPRKKRYHRHTPQQIQELEALLMAGKRVTVTERRGRSKWEQKVEQGG